VWPIGDAKLPRHLNFISPPSDEPELFRSVVRDFIPA